MSLTVVPLWGETVGWILLHSVWQGAILGGALAIVLRVLPPSLARARYAVACATLALMVVLPTATGLEAGRLQPDVSHPASQSREASVDATLTAPSPAPSIAHRVSLVPTRIRIAAQRSDRDIPASRMLRLVAAVWSLGVVLLGVRLAGGWMLNRNLTRRGVTAAPAEWLAMVARLRVVMGIRRPVRLLVSMRVAAPVLIGWVRPLVLLPASALTGLAPWQVELLLRHELAHVRRYDYLVNLLQSVAEVLLFHHPVAWWVSRQIRAEREHCCDDAVALTAGAPAYIRALVAMEELRGRAALAPPLMLGADGASLLRRMQRLAARAVAPAPGVSGRQLGALAALLLGVPMVIGLAGALAGGAASAPPSYAATVPPGPAATAVPTGPWAAPCAIEDALTTTICEPLTDYVTAVLQRRGMDGAVVVQDVLTGAVISYASASSAAESNVTRAMMPASIWKLSLAALWWEEGMGDREVPCADEMAVGATSIRHWRRAPRGTMNAAGMLVESCNTAAAHMALELRDRLGPDGMRDAFSRLGFQAQLRDDAALRPGSNGGADRMRREEDFWATASLAWRERMSPARAVLRLPSRDDDAAWAGLGVGQAVEVTPLHVARFLQAVGNDGVMQHPTIEPAYALREDSKQRIMKAATARRMQDAMRTVVREGTARGISSMLHGARWTLGGKTGSARAAESGQVDGWFAGLLFDERAVPRYAVVVYLQGSGPGGGESARFAADITRRLGGTH